MTNMPKMVFMVALAVLVARGMASACSSSEGYAWDDNGPVTGEDLQAARQVASALCDVDSDRLNFAGLVTVSFYVTSTPKTVIQISSLRLAEALAEPETLKNLSITYGGDVARMMDPLPVFVQFFHLRADGGGTARATYRVALENEKITAEPTDAAR